MAEKNRTEYRVKKVTFETRLCPTCGGKQTRDINLGNNQHKTAPCSTCNGTGAFKMEHGTDIDLRTALNEMGIYKLIENTVKEILTTDTTNKN